MKTAKFLSLIYPILACLADAAGTGLVPVSTPVVYSDGRPYPSYRMPASDHGKFFDFGGAPNQTDSLGIREALINQVDGKFYLYYDGAGPNGWLAHLAVSTDMENWVRKGPILDFGGPGTADSAAACAPWIIKDDAGLWHMFYLGTPNVSPAPDLIPSLPYHTLRASAPSPAGPWTKHYTPRPFITTPGTYYSDTASPGHVVKSGDTYLQFFSASAVQDVLKRTLGIARTGNLEEAWTVDPAPMVPVDEQIENSSIYYEPANQTWFLFTNHIGIAKEGEFTDGIWVYWTKDLNDWNSAHKAVVLDGSNCAWSRRCIGMPSVTVVGDKLHIFYDAPGGDSISHMHRSLGMATLQLPLDPSVPAFRLEDGFRSPPEETKPWCYWYWLNGDISRAGITKDLEAMAEVGIKRAMIGNIGGQGGTAGSVVMFSPEWYALTRHALSEANRLGVQLMSFNGPGWSQSGGPWIQPGQSMRRVTWAEYPVAGGAFQQLVRPAEVSAGQDIAVVAVPRLESVTISGSARSQALPGNSSRFTHTEPFTARGLVVHGKANAKLYAMQNGQRQFIADIVAAGGSGQTDFLPNGIETFSFADVTAQEFELEPNPGVPVELTSAPTVAQVIEKQMGRMHPTPSPTWESYIFPATVEPATAGTVVRRQDIINLTDHLGADGVLNGTLPDGNWTIIYFGMVTTGKRNHPAPPEATGLEVDKMNRKHVEHHFDLSIGPLLAQLTPQERSAFMGITIDSYEVGSQNWTDGFAAEFATRNGYDPIAMLPVMTGRVVESAAAADQFLWDLRRTVADMIAENYVGGLRDVAHQHGLTLWSENYGHWGFPGEFLIYGGYTDEVGGEFWTTGDLGTIECRAASSAAHIYGKPRVYAEGFTSQLRLEHHPYLFKARGEELFCEGINHLVLHVYAHQPRDGVPGNNPRFGTAFHRNTPWFKESRDWMKYLQRCHYMLQQGEPVADVAVFIGDFAPQMTGPANPVPTGHDYDYIGSDVILRGLQVVDGEWVVRDENDPARIAARWKVLALPESGHLRPQVQRRLDQLKSAGGQVIDAVPVTAVTLSHAGIIPIVSGTSFPVRWKARRLDDGMLFFLSNFGSTGTFEATLRVEGKAKAPTLFNPATGEITKLARFKTVPGGTQVTIDVKDKSDAFFVVFSDAPNRPSVVAASAPPSVIKLSYDTDNQLMAESGTAGAYDLTLSDGTTRQVLIEQGSQTFAVAGPWQATPQDASKFSVLHETSFALPAGWGAGQRVTLDLGAVSVMAKVTLNGQSFDTLWMPPFTLDVTDALKPGANQLKILVTSTSVAAPSLGADVRLMTTQRIEAGTTNQRQPTR